MNANGNNRPLVIPALGNIYSNLGELSETILRVITGIALIVHGSGKIMNPFGLWEWSKVWGSIQACSGLRFCP